MTHPLNPIQSHAIHLALLLSAAITVPANAASFDITSDTESQSLNIMDDLANFDQQVEQQRQSMEKVKSHYLSVLDLIKNNNPETAQSKVTALLEKDPKQSIYHNLQAILHLINKDNSAAEQSFVKAVNLNAKNSQALTGLAKLSLDNKQLDKAKGYADQILAINPYEIKAYQVLANVTMQQQGLDAVETLLLEAHTKVKMKLKADLAILQALGKVYITKKQPEKLLQLATDFNERHQDNSAALSFLTEAQLLNNDEVGAEKTLRQIIVKQPNDAKHLFLLARLLDQQKNKETEVLNLLDKAILNNDNPVLLLSYKTAVLLKQKHYTQASKIAQQVDESNPTQSIGKILKGDVALAQKKYPDALLNYQQAYALTPNIKVLDAILKILSQQNKHKQAVSLLETELAKAKDNPAVQFRLAVAYQTTEQYDLSKQYYETLLIQQKDNVIILNNLAHIYNLQHNPKAISLAKQAYQLAPKSGAIADTYGYLLLKQGNKQDSLKILKQAVELDPRLAEIQLHLAESYLANENKEPAKNILEKLINNQTGTAIEQKKAQQLLESL